MSPRHIVVMGVSGSGKTTVGTALAQHLTVPFTDGDTLHSDSNRAKMAAGIPLEDSDRWSWLAGLRDWMSTQSVSCSVVACSALKRAYRDVLRGARGGVAFVQLTAPPDVLAGRMESRTGHYMPPSLLLSQLDILESLAQDEAGLILDADNVTGVLGRVLEWLRGCCDEPRPR